MAAADVPINYRGTTVEHRKIVVTAKGNAIIKVRASVGRYVCETFGELGPRSVVKVGLAPMRKDGSFDFRAGEPVERVILKGRRKGRTISGTVRLAGSIATGQRCSSLTLRFRASR